MIPFDVPLTLTDEAATERLARDLAQVLVPGDCLLLWGSIGAGKTSLARALIKSLLPRDEDVPSPTFTLVQTYDSRIGEIWHCDLYRLSHPDEVMELGLEQAFETAICLIEWPDRLGDLAPATALSLYLTAGEFGHSIRFAGSAAWQARLGGLDV